MLLKYSFKQIINYMLSGGVNFYRGFLANYLQLDCFGKVRMVEGLRDQELLSYIALYDDCRKARSRAIQRLDDEEVIKDILFHEYDDKLLFRASQRLMRLNPNSELFYDLNYVMSLEDEEELIDIYKNSIYKAPVIIDGSPVDMSAVYYYLVYWDERWGIRWAIASNPNLKDKKVLKSIVLKDYHTKVRRAALENPNFEEDEDFYCALALWDCKDVIRGIAASRISNEPILKQLALNEDSAFIRHYAVDNPNLTDQETLIHIALNDRHYGIRKDACLKINDADVLRQVIKKDYHSWVVKAAKERLKEIDNVD